MRSEAVLRVASWCLLFMTVVVLFLLSSGRARATNDPPLSGGQWDYEWTVTDNRLYAGCTITLGGNLTVAGTGKGLSHN